MMTLYGVPRARKATRRRSSWARLAGSMSWMRRYGAPAVTGARVAVGRARPCFLAEDRVRPDTVDAGEGAPGGTLGRRVRRLVARRLLVLGALPLVGVVSLPLAGEAAAAAEAGLAADSEAPDDDHLAGDAALVSDTSETSANEAPEDKPPNEGVDAADGTGGAGWYTAWGSTYDESMAPGNRPLAWLSSGCGS